MGSTQVPGAGAIRQTMNPTSIKTSTYPAAPWDLVLLDISGGSFAVPLPAASLGKWEVTVKVKVGATPIGSTAASVTPAGTDTLNGNATALPLRYQGLSKTFTSDGISNVTVTAGDTDKTTNDQLYRGGRQYMDLPTGWDAGWKAGLASGNPQIAVVGTSISAGEAGGTQADAVTYGYVGRLKAMLMAKYGLADGATFWGAGGLNPGLTSPTISSMFTWTGAARNYDDGGFGQVFASSDTAAWDCSINVTGAVQLDLFLVDGGTGTTCQYQVDSATAQTITGGGGNNNTGNGHLRRVTIPLSGNTTVKVGQASVSRAMSLAGFTVFNSTTAGLMVARGGIQGYKAVDFAVGGGAAGTGSSVATTTGALSQTPDHIKPWSGITDTFNLVSSGFPVGAHLAIIEPGTNDISYRTELGAWERAIQRKISAFRAARPNCSIAIPNMCYPGIYSTNAGASISPYAKQKYMNLLQAIAARNNAAFINVDQAFGEDPITPGYMVAANIHPTSNGVGASGGDGHLYIAQLLNQIL